MQNTRRLIDYTNKVRRLAEDRTGEPIYNDSLEHAAVILQSLFAHARDSVCILTGKLNEDAYGRIEIVEAAQRFVESPGHRIRILFEDELLFEKDNITRHPFLAALTEPDFEKRLVPKSRQRNYKFHFIVVDDDCYRFEPDREKYEAVAAFGDPVGGQNLKKLFHQLWREADNQVGCTVN